MYFCVAPVSAIPYVGLLLCGFPLQSLQLLLVCVKNSRKLVISLLIDRLLFLSTVSDPNRPTPYQMPLVLPAILFKAVSLSLCPFALF